MGSWETTGSERRLSLFDALLLLLLLLLQIRTLVYHSPFQAHVLKSMTMTHWSKCHRRNAKAKKEYARPGRATRIPADVGEDLIPIATVPALMQTEDPFAAGMIRGEQRPHCRIAENRHRAVNYWGQPGLSLTSPLSMEVLMHRNTQRVLLDGCEVTGSTLLVLMPPCFQRAWIGLVADRCIEGAQVTVPILRVGRSGDSHQPACTLMSCLQPH